MKIKELSDICINKIENYFENNINNFQNNLTLTGKWGSGKTTIINKIIDELDKNEYEIINISL